MLAPHKHASKPHKFLIDGITPSADQMNRGDCWLFATTGILEDSYRRFGVQNGWFPKGSYLRLSRQALGIATMELCRRSPNMMCPMSIGPGHTIDWANTTEGLDGSDEKLFAHLKGLGAIGAIPNTICPYYFNSDWREERKCDGLEAYRSVNPLRFTVRSMKYFYDKEDIKAALLATGRPLSIGLSLAYAPFYVPCEERAGCDRKTAQCVACPLQRIYANVECCILSQKPMVSMKGEWFLQPDEPLVIEGGHAINIVGYSDTYRDEWGNTGGFIVRNTWADGLGTAHGLKARGSHSAQYYAQMISDSDEAISCPNPHSPRSWVTCDNVAQCRSAVIAMEAKFAGKVLELRCIDLGFSLPQGACKAGRGYFLTNMTEWGSSGLYNMCFLKEGMDGTPDSTFCLPPLTIDDVATIFTPVDIDSRPKNNKALCGFNFIAYETYAKLQVRFGNIIVTSFDIEWSPSSYVSNAKPGLDYSLIKDNTHPLQSVTLRDPTLS